MNLSFDSSSLNILHSKFFNMFLLVGDVRISYAKVVILSFPLSSPSCLLYEPKAGMTMFCFPVSIPALSLSW